MPYHHFTPHEQYIIAHLTSAGFSQREIGRRLGRHHASIGREIRRNRPSYADDAVYWYDAERLVSYVTCRLRLDWPPEAIAGRLNVDYPDDASMRTCRMGRFLEMVNLPLVEKDHIPSQEGDLRHESRISVVSESSVLIN